MHMVESLAIGDVFMSSTWFATRRISRPYSYNIRFDATIHVIELPSHLLLTSRLLLELLPVEDIINKRRWWDLGLVEGTREVLSRGTQDGSWPTFQASILKSTYAHHPLTFIYGYHVQLLILNPVAICLRNCSLFKWMRLSVKNNRRSSPCYTKSLVPGRNAPSQTHKSHFEGSDSLFFHRFPWWNVIFI